MMDKLPMIKQSFTMQFEYQLHFTSALFSANNLLLRKILLSSGSKALVGVLVVVDEGVSQAHKELIAQIQNYGECHKEKIDLKAIVKVKGGEQAKIARENLDAVLHAINLWGICRHSFVLAIGGGAVMDMVGYAAATAHRGVKLIRIPTTVLAQNDAAVGVKNGVNFFDKKNFLGTFAPPVAIINDFDFLSTLAQRDWISGIAEAVKVAAIKDEGFFCFLEDNALKMAQRDRKAMAHMIYRCAELHMQHIANGGDPFESGSSRPLDFGHWAAHKLEQMTNYTLRHGEAVAMGIALDVTYAQLIGLVDETTLDRIVKVLTDIGFDLRIPLDSDSKTEELLQGIEEFREHLGGELTITLIRGIGQKYDVNEIDKSLMRSAIAKRRKAKALYL